MSEAKVQQKKEAKKLFARTTALRKHKKGLELALNSHMSTCEVLYIGKEEFIFIYECKHPLRNIVLNGLMYYMNLVGVDYEFIKYGLEIEGINYTEEISIPVLMLNGATVEAVQTILATMTRKDLFLNPTDPIQIS